MGESSYLLECNLLSKHLGYCILLVSEYTSLVCYVAHVYHVKQYCMIVSRPVIMGNTELLCLPRYLLDSIC